jgi:prolyl-tRNA synthetase
MKNKTAIEPTREEDFPEWYQQVIRAAELAEHSPVRGCMVIRPWGYSIWENMQRILDQKFKETGHQNAYFPLFIPLSFFEKEAQHIEGFAKECAIVTHHRLEKNSEGRLVPAGELEEPLIVRPTSEMIIGAMYAKWVESYRDLPILINQWANVVRWEMRTRIFLRSAEFLWQEGHTAHATREEAEEETLRMLDVYVDFAQKYMAVPVIKGEKTPSERFPGAVATYCIEAMMQDRKALQGGTSHFLGQNFSKSCGIEFFDKDEQKKYAWTTSWGMTTRMIGALVMTHSDDDGLVMPPRVAGTHVVILPVMHKEETRKEVISHCHALAGKLRHVMFDGRPLTVIVDERDMRGGDKTWSWIKKGVPIRIEIGPRDIANNQFPVARRDKPHKELKLLSQEQILETISQLLTDIQDNVYSKALAYREANIQKIDTKEEFYRFFSGEEGKISGGFAFSHWSGDPEVEEIVKKDLSVTIRCIPFNSPEEEGRCVISGKKSMKRVIFAKSY